MAIIDGFLLRFVCCLSCSCIFQDELPLKFKVTTDGNKWQGEAVIPSDYFPPKVSKFNAYAIHGEGEGRVYEALNPVPNGAYSNPDL